MKTFDNFIEEKTESYPMRLFLTLFTLSLAFNYNVTAQDLKGSKVAFVNFSGKINEDIISGLDDYTPASDREKKLASAIENRLEQFYQDMVFDMLVANLEAKGIKMLSLEASAEVAKLNSRGYPSPLSPKGVIKKKNKGIADYFINISVNASKPFGGGLLGIKPTINVRLIIHDSKGEKLKTINDPYKAADYIRPNDFDEPWTFGLDGFDRLDWFYVEQLLDLIAPTVEGAIKQAIKGL